MNFVSVDERLKQVDREIEIVPLQFLNTANDINTYTEALLQPAGDLQSSENGVKHKDPLASSKLYASFLKICIERCADLVVAPEYCVPLTTIKAITPEGLCPKKGQLWALGTESITPAELEDLNGSGTDGELLIHDPFEAGGRRFFSPVIYVFWIRNRDQDVLCKLFQFKICSSAETVEANEMISGQRIFYFGGKNNELKLFSLICADVFKLEKSDIIQQHNNAIILHIQLNPKPWYKAYSLYRETLYSLGSKSCVELQCVNWSTGLRMDDQPFIATPNSAFYLPQQYTTCLKDSTIDSLHRKGLYYHHLPGTKWDVFYLNYQPQICLLRKYKVKIDRDQVLALKFEIDITAKYTQRHQEHFTPIDPIVTNDGMKEVFKCTDVDNELNEKYQDFEKQLTALHQSSPLSLERCTELLAGPKNKPKTWHERGTMLATELAPLESCRRLSVFQDDNKEREGYSFKQARLRNAFNAATLTRKEIPFPQAMSDFENGFKFTWSDQQPYLNVVANSDTAVKGTLVYLGETSAREADNTHMMLDKCIRHQLADLEDADDFQKEYLLARDKICVVYRSGHKYHTSAENRMKQSIERPLDQSITSIDSEH